MARTAWAVPVVIGLVGTGWIAFLGWDIWATPDAGRPTETELVGALGDAVNSRDADELQALFTAADLPPDYAADYLGQVPTGARAVARASSDLLGPMVTLQVTGTGASRCTSWRVTQHAGRFVLAPGPVLGSGCTAN